MLYFDRVDAGRCLADRLRPLADENVAVVGLPRGGVPVAFEVATALRAPLDVLVVRKLGVPFQPELAMGAIGEGGVRIINEDVLRAAQVSPQELAVVEERERAELERQARRFRGDRPPLALSGRTVVVIDDGLATGATAEAACRVARAHGARRVLLAVPVGPKDILDRLHGEADDVYCLDTPDDFFAVGQAYAEFRQTGDDEVVDLLDRAARGRPGPHYSIEDPPQREVVLPSDQVQLHGELTLPSGAPGIVLFAHGSGSSRHSPRNRHVAEALNDVGLATALFDLLTVQEELHRANVFDIDVLGQRLLDITAWLRTQPDVPRRIGYFGASTGAAAALWAAAAADADIAAVVSRGGRPDLAGDRLALVRAPTLLIVGGRDDIVIGLNQAAQHQLRCPNELTIVPGATHLFEEPGTLDAVAQLAAKWFSHHLADATAVSPPE